MNDLSPRHNPFLADEQLSLAEVLEVIGADKDLDVTRRRNVCSSIRTFARLVGQDLTSMPAHPGYYRGVLKRIHPVHAGISKKRFQNVKTDVLFALRHVGIVGDGRSYLAPLSPSWRSLWDSVRRDRLRYYLSRLMHYCSVHSIAPRDVDDSVSSRFLGALVEESFIKDPKDLHRRICKAWNRARIEVQGWPSTQLTVPSYKEDLYPALVRVPQVATERRRGLARSALWRRSSAGGCSTEAAHAVIDRLQAIPD